MNKSEGRMRNYRGVRQFQLSSPSQSAVALSSTMEKPSRESSPFCIRDCSTP